MENKIKKALLEEGDSNKSENRETWNANLSDSVRRDIEEDAHYFLHQSLSSPCVNTVSRCEDIYIYDGDGREYIDFHGNSVHQVGFANPYVMGRVREQMETLPFSPRRYANKMATAAARKLTEIAPGDLNKVLFTTGGTSSIGVALKLARMVTGRYKTISMYDSFHGASLDAISVGGEQFFRNDLGPLMPGGILVPPFDSYRGFLGRDSYHSEELFADYIEYVIEKEGDVAALLAEPVRSTVVHVPTRRFWQRVREICTRNGVMLIFDEVPTCLGRTGKMFACENFDVVPDILVAGKGLGGGVIPFSAVLTSERYDIAGERALGHYTFEKNPLGAAAALAAIEYIENENLLEHVAGLSAMTASRLEQMRARHTGIGDVRGIGLLWAIELVKDRRTKEPDVERASCVMYECLDNGLSFKVSGGNILTLVPALTIGQDKMEKALDIIDEALIRTENQSL